MRAESDIDHQVYRFVVTLLNGHTTAWPNVDDQRFPPAFEALCQKERLCPLIFHLCVGTDSWSQWPAGIGADIRQHAIEAATLELVTSEAQAKLLAALAAANVEPIVLKGAAIAYTHYPGPSLRSKSDFDLLFRRQDLGGSFRVMEKFGYRYQPRPGLLGQELGYRPPADSCLYHLDIHWRVTTYPLLADVLDYDEIRARAVRVGKNGLGLCPEHALMHACIHLVKHQSSGDPIRLLWLYDIHLMVEAMSGDQQVEFINLVIAKRVSQIASAAMVKVAEDFPSASLTAMTESLGESTMPEPSARMLLGNAHSFLVSDLFQTGSRKSLLVGLQDIFIPPPDYLLRLYGKKHILWLLVLYPYRLIEGVLLYIWRRLKRFR